MYSTQIQISNKPEDVESRKIMYSFFSVDGSTLSQKVYSYYGTSVYANLIHAYMQRYSTGHCTEFSV